MSSGVINPKREFRELPFYKIQGLSEVIVKEAIKDEVLKQDYEINYQNKISRFSPDILFALNRMGWMIYDPTNKDLDVVLVSDGQNFHIVPKERVDNPNFNREDLINEESVFPLPTDDVIEYKESLETTLGIEKGIVDERGYVSSKPLGDIKYLAEVILMFDSMHDEVLYKNYQKNKDQFLNGYEFLISQPNIIAVEKNNEGFNLTYSDANNGNVKDFVNKVLEETPDNTVMVKEEMTSDLIVKRV